MQPERLVQTSTMRGRVQLALEAIRRHWYAYGCSPSFSELGAAIGVASNADVSAIVRKLERAGLITRQRGAARAIALPRPFANSATSALLLELQARGLIVQVTPAVSAAAVLALDLATSDHFETDTIHQLAEAA